MVLYKHSIVLYLSCLFIKLKKNLKTLHFLIYYTYETKEYRKYIIGHLGKSVRSDAPHLTSYIITQLQLRKTLKLSISLYIIHMKQNNIETALSVV